MTRDEVFAMCAGLPGSTEEYPFGDGVAVFKVGGKMFALMPVEDDPGNVSLKCDPDLADELRARHAAVTAGYHLNKRHWNTVELDGTVEPDEIRWMVEHSYELVVASLTRAARAEIAGLASGG